MLIEELLGKPVFEVDLANDVEIQNTLEDIIIQAREQGLKKMGLDDLAGEVIKAVSLAVSPNDPDFKEILRTALEQNKWVDEVGADETVKLKEPGEFEPGDGQAGDDAEKEKKLQQKKVQKIASRNLKKKSDSGEL